MYCIAYKKEEQVKNELEKRIKDYMIRLEYANKIFPLVKKFDGKVINARFITELKKTGLSAFINSNTLEVVDWNIPYDDRTMIYFNLPRNAENRWDASVFIKENEGYIILWKESIKKVKKAIQEVSDLVKRWNNIVSEIERFQKELNVLTVSSIFNVPFISNGREL